jgi:hypothetical protein
VGERADEPEAIIGSESPPLKSSWGDLDMDNFWLIRYQRPKFIWPGWSGEVAACTDEWW